MTGFELPPRTVDDRDRRLVDLEAAEELRELKAEAFDRNADKWPAFAWAMRQDFDPDHAERVRRQAWGGPCRTCSPVYRARRVRCPICRHWKAIA